MKKSKGTKAKYERSSGHWGHLYNINRGIKEGILPSLTSTNVSAWGALTVYTVASKYGYIREMQTQNHLAYMSLCHDGRGEIRNACFLMIYVAPKKIAKIEVKWQ